MGYGFIKNVSSPVITQEYVCICETMKEKRAQGWQL